MMRNRIPWILAMSVFLGLSYQQGWGQSTRGDDADWPTYRKDSQRIASTPAIVRPSNQPSWVYEAAESPKTSWSSSEGRIIEGHVIADRNKYDDAIHPVIVGDRAFFGSSVDHHLHCVELKSGKELWTFASGGPIRLAPTVDHNRIYFGSDDGFAYALSIDDGTLIWKQRAAPSESWLLARGEMISRWPIRTGVMIDSGKAYFGAGIFPHEEIYVVCADAASGKILWKQDHLSEQDAGRNSLSPQGYLLAGQHAIFVPSGGSLPAALDRKNGELLYKKTFSWRTTAGGVVGGFQAMLSDDQLYSSGAHHWLALNQKTGDVGFGWFEGRQIAVQDDKAYVATGDSIAALDRRVYAVNSRRRHELELFLKDSVAKMRGKVDNLDELKAQVKQAQAELESIASIGVDWRTETKDDDCLISTGEMVFLGGSNRVTGYDRSTGKVKWQAVVEGNASGLVAARGHLLVSTDRGKIYSFPSSQESSANSLEASPKIAKAQWVDQPFPKDEWTERYQQAAEEILRHTNIRRGFCLVLESDSGRLALEIARRSGLKIYAVESDESKVQESRKLLSKTGFYGHRIVVHHRTSKNLPYSNYFADLIVSDRAIKDGNLPADPEFLGRHLKPLGGKVVFGVSPKDSSSKSSESEIQTWFDHLGMESAKQEKIDAWRILARGPLPGAGNWSHQYGNPANTAIGNDTRVKGDMSVLWYGDPGPGDMVNRHEGAVGPLSTNGRLFVQGETEILAYDAYNGTFLWKYINADANRTGVFQNQNPANLAATDDRLYHFVKDLCYELNAANGKVMRTHRLPKSKDDGQHEWGYVAVQDGLLIGAATIRKEIEAKLRRRGKQTEDATDVLFAIDLNSGEHRWSYQGQSISHHTIALAPNRVFFIDSSITSEQREEILRQDKTELAKLTGEEKAIAEERALRADIRRTIALDSSNGQVLWATPVDVTDCSDIGAGGGKLTLMYANGTLLLGGANANGHYWKQFVAGEFTRRRMVALSAEQGYKQWAVDANYKGRPIVIGEKVLAEPWAFELKSGTQISKEHPLTGKQEPWSLMRTGHHCGILTGCDSGLLMFRSGDTAFYDLTEDVGAKHFAGHRLGCWVNAIPANGLVMIPEASAGCVCQFSIASTIVLEPRDLERQWMIYSAVGALTPVKQMAINFGAPGDRKDGQGRIWLSYPRRDAYQKTSLDVALPLVPEFAPGGKFHSVRESSTTSIENPWLYSSWADGISKLKMTLLGEKDGPAKYRMKLYFGRSSSDGSKPIAFDVMVQGTNIDGRITIPPALDQEPSIIVKELENVSVTRDLEIEWKAIEGTPRLNALEITRQ